MSSNDRPPPDAPPCEPDPGDRAERWTPIGQGAWSGRDLGTALRTSRVDAYDVWAEVTAFRGVEPAFAQLPLLLELKPEVPPDEFARRLVGRTDLRVSPAYLRMPVGLQSLPFLTITVPAKGLGKALEELGPQIARYEIGFPFDLLDFDGAPPPPPVFDPDSTVVRPVLVGVIDDGIPFAHERFRKADRQSTRFEFFWDQSPGGTGPLPPRFTYGREFTQGQIDAWMGQCLRAGDVDEEHLYRLAGYRGARRQVTHGAHMADCAAGADPAAAADAPRIAGVQLPYLDVADTAGYSLAPRAFDALVYLLDCADRLGAALGAAGPCPLAVDLSYARHAGPHDGSSIFEKAVDGLIGQRSAAGLPFSVLLPAGNQFTARGHARFALKPGAKHRLQWRLLPDDRTPSFLEIWLPAGAQVTVTLTPPGRTPQTTTTGTGWTYFLGDTAVAATIHPALTAAGDGQLVFIAIAPTVAEPSGATAAPAGTWAVDVVNHSAASVEVRAWVERDGRVSGYPIRGRQSYLVDAKYRERDRRGEWERRDAGGVPVKRHGSFNGLATGERPPVIGAWVRDSGRAADYTGSYGPEKTAKPTAPTAALPGDESPVRAGVIAAKTRSNASVPMNGSSVAAALATRWAAHTMRVAELAGTSSGTTVNRAALAAAAAASEAAMPPAQDPRVRLGAGRIVAGMPSSLRRSR